MSGALAVTTIESVADEVAREVSHTFAGALVEGLIRWGSLGRRGPSAWTLWEAGRLAGKGVGVRDWEKMWGRLRVM